MNRAVSWTCFFALVCGTALACSSRAAKTPELAVAGSREAQKKLRALENEWELRSGAARAELRPQLEEFVRQHPKDPSVARARLMLAQIALAERRLGSAEEILAPVLTGPVGPTRDEAQVVLAAIDNRRGLHDRALERLAPLEGKLLSREARDQYARERTNAAIAARRWRLTVDAMIAWLAESENARAVREWTEAAIVQVPTRALSRLLADWDETADTPAESQANDWVYRVVVEYLSREALRARDPLLARDLLERAPPWLRAGESGDELSALAALAQKEAQIIGRGVGVVMGGPTEVLQRRSARVGMGIVRGLDLGRARQESSEVTMLAAENRGSTAAALGTLTGLGASVLVAGFDKDSATEALAFAESRRVPVIVMHEPGKDLRSKYGFVFGVGAEAQKRALLSAPEWGHEWAIVGDGGVSCAIDGARPGATGLPLAEWKESGLATVLILADEGCCRRVARTLKAASWSPKVVFGLEGAHTTLFDDLSPFRLASGQFPTLVRVEPGNQMGAAEQAVAEGKAPERALSRDWFFSLGYDVAKLVGQALRSLPETRVTEKAQVREHHDKTRSALLDARATLLTTSATGFSSAGRILREVHILAPGDEGK